MSEEIEQPTTEVITLAPEGLGFGGGAISVEARIEAAELHRRELEVAREIVREDPDVFTEVDADAPDDGCGDGRNVARIYKRDENGELVIFEKSRRRAKLFGGGLTASASMMRAIAGAPKQGETVLGDRQFMAEQLDKLHIEHGAHTDNHASGDNCGCGAIDKYPEITANIVAYKADILATLQALYGAAFEENRAAIEQVFGTYGELVQDDRYFANAAGRKTMNLIEQKGAVIKELADKHLEGIVVLNDRDGTTFDQRKFDEKLQARGVESEIQAFVVDTWRGRMYADAAAKIAMENNLTDDYESARKVAYADFMIRTLSVAATLTGGDLPVEARLREGREDFDLAA